MLEGTRDDSLFQSTSKSLIVSLITNFQNVRHIVSAGHYPLKTVIQRFC